jgi:hypothetical protein
MAKGTNIAVFPKRLFKNGNRDVDQKVNRVTEESKIGKGDKTAFIRSKVSGRTIIASTTISSTFLPL